jgi:integrase
MSVRKRHWTTRKGEAKTAWVVDYFDQHGDRHIETFQRKHEADAHHAKVRLDIISGKYVAPNDSLTVEDAAKQWLERVDLNGMRGSGPVEQSTLRQYRIHVRHHIVPRIGRFRLAKLSHDAVQQFANSLLTGTAQHPALSRALARKVWVSFRSLLKAAKFAHLGDGITIGNGGRDHEDLEEGKDYPKPAEIKRLVAAAKTTRMRTLLMTAAMTGLRASELRGLRWRDVDLDAAKPVLHVRQRADAFGKIGMPKSRRSTRKLPLAGNLVKALREWWLECPKGGDLGLV